MSVRPFTPAFSAMMENGIFFQFSYVKEVLTKPKKLQSDLFILHKYEIKNNFWKGRKIIQNFVINSVVQVLLI